MHVYRVLQPLWVVCVASSVTPKHSACPSGVEACLGRRPSAGPKASMGLEEILTMDGAQWVSRYPMYDIPVPWTLW